LTGITRGGEDGRGGKRQRILVASATCWTTSWAAGRSCWAAIASSKTSLVGAVAPAVFLLATPPSVLVAELRVPATVTYCRRLDGKVAHLQALVKKAVVAMGQPDYCRGGRRLLD